MNAADIAVEICIASAEEALRFSDLSRPSCRATASRS